MEEHKRIELITNLFEINIQTTNSYKQVALM
jgi:hypothetical protein